MSLRYLFALAVTLAVELPIVALWMRRGESRGWREGLWDGLLVNLSSHPLAAFCVWHLGWDFWLVEAGVVLLEATLFSVAVGLKPRRAALLSGLANLPTLLLSFLI